MTQYDTHSKNRRDNSHHGPTNTIARHHRPPMIPTTQKKSQRKAQTQQQSYRPHSSTTTATPNCTGTVCSSFDQLVEAATGDDIFNASFGTINTLNLSRALRGRDPEGITLDEQYPQWHDEEDAEEEEEEEESVVEYNYPRYRHDIGARVMDYDDEQQLESTATCSTDSGSNEEERPKKGQHHPITIANQNARCGAKEKQSQKRHQRPQTPRNNTSAFNNVNNNNDRYMSFVSDMSASTLSKAINKTCCTHWIILFVILLLGGALAVTTLYMMNIFSSQNNSTTTSQNLTGSSSTQSDLDTSFNDIVTMSPASNTHLPTGGPTDFSTFFPTLAPYSQPSTSPTAAPSTAPTVADSSKPTATPTDQPSASPTKHVPKKPTKSPSQSPTTYPSIAPTAGPSHVPSLSPIDMSTSKFFPFLKAVTADETLLANPNTPQGRALQWLDQEDEFELDISKINDASITSELERQIMLRNLHQRYALATLDFALNQDAESNIPLLEQAPQWSFPRLDVCFWEGTQCSVDPKRPDQQIVTGINWARRNLTGTLVPELGLLANLTTLDIAQNQIQGTLEPLYQLTNAQEIFVFENQLSGPLTRNLEYCPNLTRFMAGFNQLTGSLPALSMKHLNTFIVHHNQFTGAIPAGLNLENLLTLDISYNSISQPIPYQFVDSVPGIKHLYLSHNKISGTVPENFVNLGKGRVYIIYLNNNQLTGQFPTGFEETKHLTNLDLSSNLFTSRLGKMCRMSVFEYGELVEMRADCRICNCIRICRTCHDNVDHMYEYDDDDWTFDDDALGGGGDDDGDDDAYDDDNDGVGDDGNDDFFREVQDDDIDPFAQRLRRP